jgi:hypothetical protein
VVPVLLQSSPPALSTGVVDVAGDSENDADAEASEDDADSPPALSTGVVDVAGDSENDADAAASDIDEDAADDEAT